MKRLSTLLVSTFLAFCSQSAMAGSWGPTFSIELRGDGLAKPLEITEPSILEKLSFWVGPGTNMTDFMRPDGSEKSIVNWDTGVVTERPAGLQRVEVKFRVGPSPESTAAFFVLYEMELGSSTGYIYHPITNSAIVAHVGEGAWRYASDRWNEMIRPIFDKHMIAGAKGEFSCQLQAFDPDAPGITVERSCWPDSREPSIRLASP